MDCAPEDIIERLQAFASDAAIEAMTRAIQTVIDKADDTNGIARKNTAEVLTAIVDEAEDYLAEEVFEGESPLRLLRLLRRIADHPASAVEQLRDTDRAIASLALTCLWQAARNVDCLRVENARKGPVTKVRVNGSWKKVSGDADEWVRLLAGDEDGWHSIAGKAIDIAAGKRRTPDLLRPFREMARYPTRRRLENILKRDQDEDDLEPCASAIQWAIMDLKLFGGDLPDNWFERIADNPSALKKIAQRICKEPALARGKRGPIPDENLYRYAERISEIIYQITGPPIKYTKTTEVHETPHVPHGPELDFLTAALRLIDPGLDEQSAIAKIHQIRGWEAGGAP